MVRSTKPLLAFSVLGLIALACGGGDDDAAAAAAKKKAKDAGADGEVFPPGQRPVGSGCDNDDQCEGKCTDSKCAPPTSSDGKLSPSLGETDVDCGGTQAPACALAKACVADTDCSSSICGGSKKCVAIRSCGETNGPAGSQTCGQGEVGEPTAKHESCCTSPLLPGSTTRSLDRYLITGGRIREFLSVLASQNNGDPNVRAFAKNFATQNPASQLGRLEAAFPGFIDAALPDSGANGSAVALSRQLGSPVDPSNKYDGCFVADGAYGHATYWQDPEVYKAWGEGSGDPPSGKRAFSREILDTKPMNCAMPLMLATFCAWDGGELATPTDYRTVWGRNIVQLPGGPQVTVPWASILNYGQFNWMNGHGGGCPLVGWPGCNPAETEHPFFYQWPQDATDPANDDTPTISPPGRFPLDVTAAVSATDGRGWWDIEGLLQAVWLQSLAADPAYPTKGLCDTTGGGDEGLGPCSRDLGDGDVRAGVFRYTPTAPLPQTAYIGYSFEGHADGGETYFAAATDDEANIKPWRVPLTFQYGKLGGRCARVVKP